MRDFASIWKTARTKLGAIALDVPRAQRALWSGDRGYLAIHNRGERLLRNESGDGYRCDWQWTRELHVARVMPSLARRIMAQGLADHPIGLAGAPPSNDTPPRISFLIGHRGTERATLLLTAIASIAAQDIPVEIVVVEQSAMQQVRALLPPWVKYLHAPVASNAAYNRSATLNAAATQASGEVLVLHDGDMLVPRDYARCVLREIDRGMDVVNLKRFVLYLDAPSTHRLIADQRVRAVAPEAIVQNLEGGGSVAIRAETFAKLGGMDEGFVGWGGEDNEFWDRCALARRWEYGYVALIHLWHPMQPRKLDPDNPTSRRYWELSAIAPQERIRRLRASRGSRDQLSEPSCANG